MFHMWGIFTTVEAGRNGLSAFPVKKMGTLECTEQTGGSFICPNCDSDDDAN